MTEVERSEGLSHEWVFSVDDAIRAMTEVQPGMNFIKERNQFFVETYLWPRRWFRVHRLRCDAGAAVFTSC